MDFFVRGAACISPQDTFRAKKFLTGIRKYDQGRLTCIEPSYKDFLAPKPLRRMSRNIRIAVVAALECLNEAGIEMPDAISTGTGLGCVENTEKFLNSVLDDEEQLLSPTPFMQSTHNTIGSQIAILLGCTNYNVTHAHKNLAFEDALVDSIMLIKEREVENVLVGGADEITQEHFDLKKRINMWKEPPNNNVDLVRYTSKGCIPGEGAAFFLVSSHHDERDYARILSVSSTYKLTDNEAIRDHTLRVLKEAGLELGDLDLVILGINGDAYYDSVYSYLTANLFDFQVITYFKHLCGEYDTSSAFAFWTAVNILKSQEIPPIMRLNTCNKKVINNILIYNQNYNKNHSFILLSKV